MSVVGFREFCHGARQRAYRHRNITKEEPHDDFSSTNRRLYVSSCSSLEPRNRLQEELVSLETHFCCRGQSLPYTL